MVILFKDDVTVIVLFGLLLGSLSIFVLLFTFYYYRGGGGGGVEPIQTPAKEAWSSVLILQRCLHCGGDGEEAPLVTTCSSCKT